MFLLHGEERKCQPQPHRLTTFAEGDRIQISMKWQLSSQKLYWLFTVCKLSFTRAPKHYRHVGDTLQVWLLTLLKDTASQQSPWSSGPYRSSQSLFPSDPRCRSSLALHLGLLLSLLKGPHLLFLANCLYISCGKFTTICWQSLSDPQIVSWLVSARNALWITEGDFG